MIRKKAERDAVFQSEFREDLRYWVDTNRRVALRVLDLVEAIMRDPFRGIGKAEPLRHLAPNTWSRRLTEEHRIVYMVSADRIDFLQARYHQRPNQDGIHPTCKKTVVPDALSCWAA